MYILTDMPRFPNRDANLWGSKIWRPTLFFINPPPLPLPNINRPPLPFTDKHKLTQSPNCNMQNVLNIRIMKSYMKHIPSKFAFIITKLLSNSENCEWLKIFKNVDCVVNNHNEVQDMRANHKTTN